MCIKICSVCVCVLNGNNTLQTESQVLLVLSHILYFLKSASSTKTKQIHLIKYVYFPQLQVLLVITEILLNKIHTRVLLYIPISNKSKQIKNRIYSCTLLKMDIIPYTNRGIEVMTKFSHNIYHLFIN